MTGSSVVGRVLQSVGGTYRVDVEGEIIESTLRGRLKQESESSKVATGDEVKLERLAEGGYAISDVLPRRSKISRRTVHGQKEQTIAANVDQLAAVFSTKKPAPVLVMVDRFLTMAESSDVEAFVVLNKIDLTSEDEARAQFGLYERIGYHVLYTSAKEETHVDELARALTGRTTLLAGPSGVGKSTLLNVIQPGLGLAVGEVSRALEKGKHTTVAATMHRLERGGYVVDSPGLRRLPLWDVGEHELADCFPEFRGHRGECRFQDCRHVREPDCAIREAVEEGRIDESRYSSYARILAERTKERAQ